jgi:hypothetical protein
MTGAASSRPDAFVVCSCLSGYGNRNREGGYVFGKADSTEATSAGRIASHSSRGAQPAVSARRG